MEAPVIAASTEALRDLSDEARRDVRTAARAGHHAPDASSARAAVAWSRAWQRRLRAAILASQIAAACGVVYAALATDHHVPRVLAVAPVIVAIVALIVVANVLGSVRRRVLRMEVANFDLTCAATPLMVPRTLTIWPRTRGRDAASLVQAGLAGPILLAVMAAIGYFNHRHFLIQFAEELAGVESFRLLLWVGTVLYKGPSALRSPMLILDDAGITVPAWRLTVPWHQIEYVDVDFTARTLRWRTSRSAGLDALIGWRSRWKVALVDKIFSDGGVTIRLPPEPEMAIWVSRQHLEAAIPSHSV